MKILPAKPNQASALLVTMIFVLTLSAVMVTYLMIIENSGQMVSRSQYWNSSLAIAESGIEESLAQLNSGSSFSANGWSQSGGNYTLSRSLNGGTYNVVIQPGSTIDTIYSTGTVTAAISGASISRTVKITTKAEGYFNVGIGAVNNINMNGNSVAVDSWNSFDPNESNNGQYNGYSGSNGPVASEQGIVNIGGHIIQGNLYLGPNASYSSGVGQVTGTIYSDYNINFPPVGLPTTDSSGNAIVWAPAPTSTAVTHDFTNSGDYIVSDSDPIIVEAGVTVTLDVQAISFSPSSITINGGTTNSGNIFMYQEDGTATLSGNSTGGAIGNRPENFYYFGLPGVTSITWSGTSSFVGAVYAPNANLTLKGGGHGYNFLGSAIVNSITMNGHYDFHYDTALGTNGLNRGFIPTSWQEL